jgi:hypothetical protein
VSELYIWKYRGLSKYDAELKFREMLTAREALLGNCYPKTSVSTRVKTVGEKILVGQIEIDVGVRDWSSWIEENDFGIAWEGISEKHFGLSKKQGVVREFVGAIEEEPLGVGDFSDGCFVLCVWNEGSENVLIVTSAIHAPTFWSTNGLHGWAFGSRAFPLIGITGQSAAFNETAAGLYLSFGYLIGNSSLFRNVDRVPGGQRIEINSRVKTAEYADIQAFESALNFSASDFRCVVDACASSIRNRVAVEFDHSENPVLLLTGGRDSRCIGAALSKEKKDI